jgi:hypothetical protein
MNVRITAIGAAVLMLLLPLSLCCIPAPQHACCNDRCAMAPDTAPVVAVPLAAAVVLPPSTSATIAPDAHCRCDSVAAVVLYPRFHPAATIQLRI